MAGTGSVVFSFLYIYGLNRLNQPTMLVFTDYLIIAAYFLLILVVGALTGRKQEKEDFLISGRKLTSIQATTTIFSSRIGAAISCSPIRPWFICMAWEHCGTS
jgi:hypothetical protein